MILAILLLAQLWPFPGPGTMAHSGGGGSAPTHKASYSTNSDAAATTLALASTFNVAAGDCIVCLTGGGTEPTSGVTCGSDALTQATSANASNYPTHVWYRLNASANATATCTATYTGSANYRAIACTQWSGIATASALDGTACNAAACNALAAASTSRTSQNIVTTNASDLLLGFVIDWDGGTTHTETNGFTLHVDGTTPAILSKYVSSTGTHPSGNFSTTANQQYFSFIIALKTQ